MRKLLVALAVLVAMVGAGFVVWVKEGATEDRGTTTHPAPIRALQVQLDAGRVEVVGGTAPDAKVDRFRHYLRKAPSLDEAVVGGALAIRSQCPKTFLSDCRADVRVELPAAADVQVRTESAAVVVTGMSGTVDVTTSSGKVQLTRVTGPVRTTTSAGSVDGVDLSPTFLDATTGAGSIRISLAKPSPRVALHTGAGGIDLALPPAEGGYRVTAEAKPGRADVSVPQDPSSGRAVSAQTGAGRIRIHPR